jgi:hypothetical protein
LSISGSPVRRYVEGRKRPVPRPVEEIVMNQYVVAIYSPDDFDPSKQDPAMFRDITALNEEMKTARVRIFVGAWTRP